MKMARMMVILLLSQTKKKQISQAGAFFGMLSFVYEYPLTHLAFFKDKPQTHKMTMKTAAHRWNRYERADL
jgi:hypothetical protein